MPAPDGEKLKSQELMFQEALNAVHAGEKPRARDLLTRLLKEQQSNAEYWVWMSASVETSKEQVFCLKEALRLDPQNTAARRGLVILGAAEPENDLIVPLFLQKRDWQSNLQKESAGKKPIVPKYQMILMVCAILALAGIVALISWGSKQARPAHRSAKALPTVTVSATAEATLSPDRPTPSGIVQLWELLESTYTPTPLYVSTPHPISEAYRIGLRAMQNEDWLNANNYFRQAATDVAKVEPGSVDVLYYIAENARLQGKLSDAIKIYTEVIRLSPGFAPAYLGMARALTAQNPENSKDQAISNIQSAIKNDPEYVEARLELAAFLIRDGQAEEALKILDLSDASLSEVPLAYLYRAQAQLQMGDTANALSNAQQANKLDITLLPAYKIMGEAYQKNGQVAASLDPLITYTTYVKDDPQAWSMLAKAYYTAGRQAAALEALNRALQLSGQISGAYLMRAEIELDAGDAEKALDDFETALRQDPNSYAASLGIGRALMALKYPGDAWDRFERTQKLAETGIQKAELIYWRAQSLEQLGELAAAMRDYQRLVSLPPEDVEEEWVQYAQERIQKINALTPTVKPRLPSLTPTSSNSRQPSKTPTLTSKP